MIIMAKKGGLNSLSEQWNEILDEYKKDFKIELNDALAEASKMMKKELEDASPYSGETSFDSPSGQKHFKDSWIAVLKYTNVKYVGNTKTVSGGIPLSSLLEWSKKGKPFIGATFERNKDAIYQKVVNELKKGKR